MKIPGTSNEDFVYIKCLSPLGASFASRPGSPAVASYFLSAAVVIFGCTGEVQKCRPAHRKPNLPYYSAGKNHTCRVVFFRPPTDVGFVGDVAGTNRQRRCGGARDAGSRILRWPLVVWC